MSIAEDNPRGQLVKIRGYTRYEQRGKQQLKNTF